MYKIIAHTLITENISEISINNLPQWLVSRDWRELEQIFLRLINIQFTPEDAVKLKNIYTLAKDAHFNSARDTQKAFRQSGQPYIHHPLSVALLSWTLYTRGNMANANPFLLLASAICHDTIEETHIFNTADPGEQLREFAHQHGTDLALIIWQLTVLPIKLYKSDPKTSPIVSARKTNNLFSFGSNKTPIEARINKMSDKIINLADTNFSSIEFKQRILSSSKQAFWPVLTGLPYFVLNLFSYQYLVLRSKIPAPFPFMNAVHSLTGHLDYLERRIDYLNQSHSDLLEDDLIMMVKRSSTLKAYASDIAIILDDVKRLLHGTSETLADFEMMFHHALEVTLFALELTQTTDYKGTNPYHLIIAGLYHNIFREDDLLRSDQLPLDNIPIKASDRIKVIQILMRLTEIPVSINPEINKLRQEAKHYLYLPFKSSRIPDEARYLRISNRLMNMSLLPYDHPELVDEVIRSAREDFPPVLNYLPHSTLYIVSHFIHLAEEQRGTI